MFINKYAKNKMFLLKHLQTSKQNDSQFLGHLLNDLSIYLKDSDNILLLGDFNTNLENKNLQHLTDSSNLENSIHEATCFKGLVSCIDLIMTNRKSYFKITCVTVTGISVIHKLIGVSVKSQILKVPPKRKF